MELSEVESQLKFKFPARHREALLDSTDLIHTACVFLNVSDIVEENKWMHSSDYGEPWPDFLVAFASNGCGDYFAYDTRQNPAPIIYIDPDKTIEENLSVADKLRYKTFEEWYESEIDFQTCRNCQNRETKFEMSEDKQILMRVCPKCGFKERADAMIQL